MGYVASPNDPVFFLHHLSAAINRGLLKGRNARLYPGIVSARSLGRAPLAEPRS